MNLLTQAFIHHPTPSPPPPHNHYYDFDFDDDEIRLRGDDDDDGGDDDVKIRPRGDDDDADINDDDEISHLCVQKPNCWDQTSAKPRAKPNCCLRRKNVAEMFSQQKHAAY